MTQPPQYYAPPSPPPPAKGGAGLYTAALIGGVVLVLIVAVLGTVWFLTRSCGDCGNGRSAASPSQTEHRVSANDGEPATELRIKTLRLADPPSSEKGTKKCEYRTASEEELPPESEDVGSPEDGKRPDSGTQEMSIATNHGELVVAIDNEKAPCTAASFDFLAGLKYFDDSKFHRLTTEDLFVLQGGDPSATGRGGPTYQFDDEYVPKDTSKDLTKAEQEAGEKPEPNYKAGDIAMANSGSDTNGSQFFIVYKDTYLPSNYTIFGELTAGMDIVKDIAADGALLSKP